MIHTKCWNASSSTSSSASTSVPNPFQEDTPTPNVSREFSLALHANSYTEIRSMIQAPPPQGQLHFLHQDRELVQEALCNTENTTHRNLISKYFDHSETASELCLHLHQLTQHARAMYAPLLELFAIIDARNLTQSDYDIAFRLFIDFDGHDNPIPNSYIFNEVRSSLYRLKTQLDCRFRKSRSRVRIFRRATVAVAVAVAPVCGGACVLNPGDTERREIARLAQLDAAAKCAYVLSNDLGTIDRLVARLRAAVEGDKVLVRIGLDRGRERFRIQEVIKQLCKSYGSFLLQLEDLEEHIYLCFYTVNKARSLLLRELCNHQTL